MKKLFTLFALSLNMMVLAQPAGWNSNLQILVHNPNAVNAIDYQLKLSINTQSLIANGFMSPTGDDIRFAGGCNSSTFYNYWIEAGINTPTTVIWVKIPMIAANTTTLIYMFYGNPSAAATSTIPGTFRGPNSSTDSVTGGTAGGATNSQRGFRFSPNQDILVTHFGKHEPDGTTRYVTLFDYNSQAIITQTQVPGATTNYTYGTINNPIWLTSGTQYVLQLFQGSSDGYYYGNSSQIGQHLTYYDMRYCNSCTQNTFPTNILTNYHYGYPDLLYYITSTLAIVPTYTLYSSDISISGGGAICAGSSVTLTANGSGTYTWSTGPSSSSIVVSPNVTTSYSLSQASPVGCDFVAVKTITVNSGPPVITATITPNNVCPGMPVTANASGAVSYTWSNGVTNGVPFTPLTTGTYVVTGANGCGTGSAQVIITVIALPVPSAANPSTICLQEAAMLTVSGADNYTWSPGALTGSNIAVTPSATTIYTVIGTTALCTGVSTVAVTVNPLPTITVMTATNQVCEGSAVTLTATGGNNYTWTPSGSGPIITVNPVVSTLYSVTGDNSFGCVSSSSQPINVVNKPIVSASTNKANLCSGSSATLSASGADTYSWSNFMTGSTIVVTPASTTIYSVTGTSTITTCSATKTVEVNVYVPTLTITPDFTVCPGESAILVAGGATSYTWDTGLPLFQVNVTVNTPTTHVVAATTVTLGLSCYSTASVNIDVFPLPNVNATAHRSVICRNETTSITATGATTYTWSTLSTSATFTIKGNNVTTYTYTVSGTDDNGCVNTASATVKVNLCTGLEENGLADKPVSVYPNPSNGEITISSSERMDLIIVNTAGQTVRNVHLSENNSGKVVVSGLAEGMYFVKDNRGTRVLEKIIIAR